jgi:hypothetical protein
MSVPGDAFVKTEDGPVSARDLHFRQKRLWVFEPAKPVGSWHLIPCPTIVKTSADPDRQCIRVHFKETHEPILCTPDLRFLRADHSWALASSLAVGDWVVGARGTLRIHAITRAWQDGAAVVYSRACSGHTYEIQGNYTLYDDGPVVSGTAVVQPARVTTAPIRWM